MNFSKKGKLINHSAEEKKIKIKIEDIIEGINTFPDFFIKKEKGKIIYIIDRICDHNGGKLIFKKNSYMSTPWMGIKFKFIKI